MPRFRLIGGLALAAVSLFATQSPVMVSAQSGPQTLVIGVDHEDLANQEPDQGRLFDYTDFFSRDASLHTGDTIDFRFAPGSFHVIALAASEQTARAVYPIAFPDPDNRPAKGTGFPKLQLGPSNGPILGGSVSGGGTVGGPNDMPSCGLAVLGEKACSFAGPADIESSGGIPAFDPASGMPAQVDWMMQITAPTGDYDYFCYIHPGMRGKLHVVAANQAASSQSEIDARSEQQFQADQSAALQAERQYSQDLTTTDGSTVTHHVSVGVSAADNHVAIDEMLPQRIHLSQGDQVEFKWRDGHEVHTVGFAQSESQLPEPFLFDCGNSFIAPPSGPGGPPGGGFCIEPGETMPESVGDPGNALSGTLLVNPQKIVDSGLLAGTDYGVPGTIQTWSVRTDSHTVSGGYDYFCAVHDFMHGTLLIGQ